MTGSFARSYHDATKQTWRSVRETSHELDWANQPFPYKLYPRLRAVPLPLGVRETDWPALDALSGVAPPNPARLDLAWLAGVLFYSAGVTRRWVRGNQPLHFRAAPSAGGLYPIELYVVCGELDGDPPLPAGVYHFEPYEFALHPLRVGDHRQDLARAAVDEGVSAAPVSLVVTGIPWRTTWKYGARGYRHLFWDAGTILAHVLSLTTAAAVEARVLAGFIDRHIADLVGADGAEEVVLAVVPLGRSSRRSRVRPDEVEPLDLETVPLSAQVGDHATVGREHQVGELDNATAVTVWRGGLRHLRSALTTVIEAPPVLPTFDLLEDVILRRGSTRRFRYGKVPPHALTWPLAVASQPVPGDWSDEDHLLADHHVVVHSVEGLPSGAYRWTPDGPELLRPGVFRGETTTLCLEQELGGDSAYTVFHLADIEAALEAGGARAYRVAQLEGGIAAGRIQLAAFTLALGATGLTFYDDDVSRFFQTSAEPTTVTAVGTPAYTARTGRRPSEAPPARLSDGWGR